MKVYAQTISFLIFGVYCSVQTAHMGFSKIIDTEAQLKPTILELKVGTVGFYIYNQDTFFSKKELFASQIKNSTTSICYIETEKSRSVIVGIMANHVGINDKKLFYSDMQKAFDDFSRIIYGEKPIFISLVHIVHQIPDDSWYLAQELRDIILEKFSMLYGLPVKEQVNCSLIKVPEIHINSIVIHLDKTGLFLAIPSKIDSLQFTTEDLKAQKLPHHENSKKLFCCMFPFCFI